MTNTIFIWRRPIIHVSMQIKFNYARSASLLYISAPPYMSGRCLSGHHLGFRRFFDDLVLLGNTTQQVSVKGLSNRSIGRWWRSYTSGINSNGYLYLNNIAIVREALSVGCKRIIQRPFIHFSPGEQSKENALMELLRCIDQINESSGKDHPSGDAA